MKEKFLIVDDDPAIIKVATDLLRIIDKHIIVENASDGDDALEMVRANSYHAVLTDVRMPRMDGLTLLRKIHEEGISVPVILITAYADMDTVVQAMNNGACNFLSKPIRFEELKSAIEKIILGSREQIDFQETFKYMKASNAAFEVPTETRFANPLRDVLKHSMHLHGYEFTSIESLAYAFTEAFYNALVHGNKRENSKMIRVEMSFEEREVRVSVRDQGQGFDENQLPLFFDPKDLDFKRGRGIYLMRCNTDETIFSDGGKKVTLIKRRSLDQ
jgi:YesN/AraC family two-component response regulator